MPGAGARASADERSQMRLRPLPGDSFLTNMAFQLCGKVGALVLQLATLMLITRLLGVAKFGDLAAGLATVSILEAIAEFGLTATLVVRLGEAEDKAAVVGAGVLATVLTVAASLLVIVPVGAFVLSPHARMAALVLLPSSLIGVLTVTSTAYWTHRLSFRRVVGAAAAGQSAGLVAIAVAFAFGRSWTETSQLVVVGAALALAAALTFVLLVPRGRGRLRLLQRSTLADARSLLAAALPLGVAASTSLIHVRADQLVLAGYGYREGLAYYALAYRALEGLVAGIAPLAVVTFGHMSRAPRDARALVARNGGAILCATGCFAALALILLARPVLLVLGGHSFVGAIGVCRLLAPVVLISALNGLPARTLIVEGRGRLLSLVSVGGIALNVALNLLLIPHMGIDGAATATLVTESGGLFVLVILAVRALPSSQPTGLLGAAVAGTVASAVLCHALPGLDVEVALPIGIVTAGTVAALAIRAYGWRPEGAPRAPVAATCETIPQTQDNNP